MFITLSFILIAYIIITVIALIIRKKNQLPWSVFFLFNIVISIGYIVLSLTVLEDIMSVPLLQANKSIEYLEQSIEYLCILAICLLGMISSFVSLALFVFFIFRDIKEF